MRKRILICCLMLLLVSIGALFWRAKDSTGTADSIQPYRTTGTNSVASNEDQAVLRSRSSSLIDKTLLEPLKRGKAFLDARDQWRTPIEFFGKVIDENSNPVSRAQIQMMWTDLSTRGHSERVLHSDTNGLFVLQGVSGYALSVRVEKSAFYTSVSNQSSFLYAGQDVDFVPNSASPIVFQLRKKGVIEPLITVGGTGLRTMRDFVVSKDGTPIEISLVTGKPVAAGQGDLKVECWTSVPQEKGERFDWKCRLSVPNGGLLESRQEFAFFAPKDGYLQASEINMPVGLGDEWSRQAERIYFLRLSNGNFARVRFKMIAGGSHFFRLESFLNPSGSRNLEYDPAVQPKAGHQ